MDSRILGSSLTFSAQGGSGKEKKLSAEKIGRPKRGRGGRGVCGDTATPERSAEHSEAVSSGYAFWICVSDLAK
jgi:hypothetical protein